MELFDKEEDWRIELYEKVNRVWTLRETLLEFRVTMEEAYEVMKEFSTAYPPNIVIDLAQQSEQYNSFELRLVAGSNYQAVIVCWQKDAVQQCVEHYKSLDRKLVKAVVELELLEEDGDDPEWWDWSMIAGTGRIELVNILSEEVVHATKESVVELVEPTREEC